MWVQWRLKSVCIFAQSDRSLHYWISWKNFASLVSQNMPSEDSDQAAQMGSWSESSLGGRLMVIASHICRSIWMFRWLVCLRITSLHGLNPAGGKIQLTILWCFNAQSLPLSPFYLLDIASLDGSFGCASDWRSGGRGFDPRRGRQHSFVEIDHEIFSTVILSLPLIQEGQLSVSGERMCTILVNRLVD